MKIIIISRIT